MIQLLAYDAAGAPIQRESLAVEVIGPGIREAVTLKPDPGVKGRYAEKFAFPAPGDYRVVYGSGTTAVATELTVKRSPEELRYPNVNRQKLRLLAQGSGGKVVEMTDNDWVKAILDRIEQSRLETRKNVLRKDEDLWDNWMTLVLLVAVYSIDIALRRLAGLS
jgi:hypothetical protein